MIGRDGGGQSGWRPRRPARHPRWRGQDGQEADDKSVAQPSYGGAQPAHSPDQPAATFWPAPAPKPELKIVLQPQAEPEPKRERRATGREADEQPRKRRDKDGGLSPGQIRKGTEK